MDKNNLSKLKYIYRIYESEDKKLHLERYPIVYINQEVVYFKTGRDNMKLPWVRCADVKDDFVEFGAGYYGCALFNQYFWGLKTSVQDIFDHIQIEWSEYRNAELKTNVERQYRAAKERYERLKKQCEELGIDL